MTTFEPNGTFVLLRDLGAEKTIGGVIVPDTGRRFEVECEVVAVGRDCEWCKVGDVVFVHVNDCRNTTIGHRPARLIEEAKILGRLCEAPRLVAVGLNLDEETAS